VRRRPAIYITTRHFSHASSSSWHGKKVQRYTELNVSSLAVAKTIASSQLRFNISRWFKAPQRPMSCHATDLAVCKKSSSDVCRRGCVKSKTTARMTSWSCWLATNLTWKPTAKLAFEMVNYLPRSLSPFLDEKSEVLHQLKYFIIILLKLLMLFIYIVSMLNGPYGLLEQQLYCK